MGSIFSTRKLTAAQQEIEDARTREFGKMPDCGKMSDYAFNRGKVSKEFKQYTKNVEATLEPREGHGHVEGQQDMKAKLLKQGLSD